MELQIAAMRGALVLLVLADDAAEAKIALNVAREESWWSPWARNGSCTEGAPLICCGVGQIAQPHAWGSTCARLRAIELESWSVTLRVIRSGARACRPTWHRALTVYVSGHCGWGEAAARARCQGVGLCEHRPRQ